MVCRGCARHGFHFHCLTTGVTSSPNVSSSRPTSRFFQGLSGFGSTSRWPSPKTAKSAYPPTRWGTGFGGGVTTPTTTALANRPAVHADAWRDDWKKRTAMANQPPRRQARRFPGSRDMIEFSLEARRRTLLAHGFHFSALGFKTSRHYHAGSFPNAFAGEGRNECPNHTGTPGAAGVAVGFGIYEPGFFPHHHRRTPRVERPALWHFACRPTPARLRDWQNGFGKNNLVAESHLAAHRAGPRDRSH